MILSEMPNSVEPAGRRYKRFYSEGGKVVIKRSPDGTIEVLENSTSSEVPAFLLE
jgi:hypothetical protein